MESKPPGEGKNVGGVKLEIKMDEATAQGKYANMAVVNFTETEFVLDFLYIQPRTPGREKGEANVLSRIISSPVHAKRFLNALAESVRMYEQRFGAIDVSPKGSPGSSGQMVPTGGILH